MKIQINVRRRRGAVTTERIPGTLECDLKECVNIIILNCNHSFKGKPGTILAKQWLFGKGSKLKTLLTVVPCPAIRKEAFKDQNFKGEFERAKDPRKLGLGAKQRRLCNIL